MRWRKELTGQLASKLDDVTLDNLYERRPQLIGIFVKNAPCHLKEVNINPNRGLANGTPGRMHSITFAESDQPEYYQRLIRESLPGQVIDIPIPLSINVEIEVRGEDNARIQNWPNALTLQNRACDERGNITIEKAIVIPITIRSSRKPIKFLNSQVNYKDHFLDLAFAITFHKVQGKTLKKII